jgi:tetratricopeptide (TPR) repeat protein
MRKLNILAAAMLASGLLGTSVGAMAQSGSQSSSNQSAVPSAPTPVAPAKDKSKPGTTPAANADPNAPPAPDSPQNAPSQSTAPNTPPAPAKKPSTADDNPFPEEVSKDAAAAAKAAATNTSAPDAPNQTPAERQAQGSSSRDNTDQLGLDDPARKQLKLESPDGTTDIYDPKRATDDVRVGKFYLQTGYYKGAYERFKDATTFDHENVEAVFYLAEAARKLNLAKEAEQNYQLYLAAVPDGPSAKAAKKALGELGSSSKP